MRIINTPPIRPTDKTGKKKSSSATGADFEGFLDSTGDSQAAQNAAPVQGANSFLFLQEVSDEEANRRKALQQGKSAIQALEELHRDLLLGRVPEATLRRLEATVAQKRAVFVEPKLQQLLDEIELRAAVELAKLDRARNR